MRDQRRWRVWLAVFFVALLVPLALLVYEAYSQLKWESFYQHRLLADEFTDRVNTRLSKIVAEESSRSFSDYSFLLVGGDSSLGYLQRSPLASLPVGADLAGIVGYFQVDAGGRFSTPILPPDGNPRQYGLAEAELIERQDRASAVLSILSRNQLVVEDSPGATADIEEALAGEEDAASGAPAEVATAPVAQSAFDRLSSPQLQDGSASFKEKGKNLGRVDELKLDRMLASKAEAAEEAEGSKEYSKEQSKVESDARRNLNQPGAPAVRRQQEQVLDTAAEPESGSRSEFRIRAFESEIGSFEFSLLEDGHWVLYRYVWREKARYVQGLLIDQERFIDGLFRTMFMDTAIATMSDLLIAIRGDVVEAISTQSTYESPTSGLEGSLLSRARLVAPFDTIELIYTVRHLPVGPGAGVIAGLAGTLLLILCGGFTLMYRLVNAQIKLARQQQDFVSAVSHELKTPLTSIRMYGEMLREGWASEDKKLGYYNFIHDESERLSRLIENVLQLARMTRGELSLELRQVSTMELMSLVTAKVTAAEQAGFALNLSCPPEADRVEVNVDPDAFVQIIINLVDNAIKFSGKADQRQIDLTCSLVRENLVRFSVRDYGPGIASGQLKKIFQLFYRAENELTRQTVGTGIGLALIRQLAEAMGAKVDVINRQPGAEFLLDFPRA